MCVVSRHSGYAYAPYGSTLARTEAFPDCSRGRLTPQLSQFERRERTAVRVNYPASLNVMTQAMLQEPSGSVVVGRIMSSLLAALVQLTIWFAPLTGSGAVSEGAPGPAESPLGTGLKPGEIFYADSGNAVEGGFIIKVDPATGGQTVVSSGGNLVQPFDVKLDAQGRLIITDTGLPGALIRIDPATGQQTVIKEDRKSVV